MDFYCASGMSLLWCCFFQTVAICWIYGADKVYDNIHHMIGTRINKIWYWCWMVVSPAFMLVSISQSMLLLSSHFNCILMLLQSIFIFYFVKYTPIKYAETYHYPGWGEALGFMISFSSMIWVPAYALYYLLTTKGSLRERLRKGIKPAIKMRSDAVSKKMSIAPPKEVEMNLMTQEVDTTNHV